MIYQIIVLSVEAFAENLMNILSLAIIGKSSLGKVAKKSLIGQPQQSNDLYRCHPLKLQGLRQVTFEQSHAVMAETVVEPGCSI